MFEPLCGVGISASDAGSASKSAVGVLDRQVSHRTGSVRGSVSHIHGGHHQLRSRVGTTSAERPMGHSALAGESGSP
jgi:hypothetical protein